MLLFHFGILPSYFFNFLSLYGLEKNIHASSKKSHNAYFIFEQISFGLCLLVFFGELQLHRVLYSSNLYILTPCLGLG